MSKYPALTRGILIFAILAVLTAIEFGLARLEVAAVFLWAVALLKAGLVVWFFMHLPRVFKSESEGDHEA